MTYFLYNTWQDSQRLFMKWILCDYKMARRYGMFVNEISIHQNQRMRMLKNIGHCI